MSDARVCGIFRYPVKSLGGEALESVELTPGRGLAFDRRWALAVADLSPMLKGDEKWRPWNFCLSLKRTDALAELRAIVAEEDAANPVLEIAAAAGGRARGRPADAGERKALEMFLRRELADERIILAESESAPLWDERGVAVSLLNAASMRELSGRMNLADELTAERFRANLVLEGLAPWAEEEWTGEILRLESGAVLRTTEMTQRCAATRVNPQTGARDANVPEGLVANYGHADLGIYADPLEKGGAARGYSIFRGKK